jgi:hypothetical protein
VSERINAGITSWFGRHESRDTHIAIIVWTMSVLLALGVMAGGIMIACEWSVWLAGSVMLLGLAAMGIGAAFASMSYVSCAQRAMDKGSRDTGSNSEAHEPEGVRPGIFQQKGGICIPAKEPASYCEDAVCAYLSQLSESSAFNTVVRIVSIIGLVAMLVALCSLEALPPGNPPFVLGIASLFVNCISLCFLPLICSLCYIATRIEHALRMPQGLEMDACAHNREDSLLRIAQQIGQRRFTLYLLIALLFDALGLAAVAYGTWLAVSSHERSAIDMAMVISVGLYSIAWHVMVSVVPVHAVGILWSYSRSGCDD